jgi:hypothetical protein
LVLGLLAGCGGSSSEAPVKTDAEWCQQACMKLAACGVAYDSTCAPNCLLAPVFLACVKASAQECNPLAVCAFRQAGAAFCGSEEAGTPSAGGTCKAAADCEGACTAAGQPVNCGCKCWTGLSRTKALNLLINNECANGRCRAECAPTGNAAACFACFGAKCASESAQCQGN